jgi:hypothetical protein
MTSLVFIVANDIAEVALSDIGCADAYPQVTDADVIIFGSKEFSQSRGPPIGRQSA